jgi:anti-anti-sigma factor
MPSAQVDLAMTVTYGTSDEATVRLCEGLTRQEDVRRQLAELVETRPSRVTLDLATLGRLSSAGLGVMLAVRRGVVDYAGELRVASLNGNLADLFRRTGLDVLFDTTSGQATAIAV